MLSFARQVKQFIPRRRKRRGRQRLRPDLSVPQFLKELAELRVDYVVLRWFEELPHVSAGEDLDILVADDHVARVRALLTHSDDGPGTPCDLYSASGVGKASFRGLPYYPLHLAEQILRRYETHASGARVPCLEDHFYSLAYHALYHKGYRSGLRQSGQEPPQEENPEHSYQLTLESLASRLGLEGISFTLQGLNQALEVAAWQPAPDLLLKLGEKNEFCAELAAAAAASWPHVPGLATFVVRSAAGKSDVEQFSRVVQKEGFDVLDVIQLDAKQTQCATRQIRGGNWGAGPFPSPGGVPAVLIVAHDVFPTFPNPALAKQHPHADNSRVFSTKLKLRDLFNAPRAPERRCNVVHSSDNARQAAHYVQVAAAERLEAILAAAEANFAALEAHEEELVMTLTSRGRRAKVELVRGPYGLVVRKTFRKGCESYFAREVKALKELRKIDVEGVIPPLLAVDTRSFVLPYLDPLNEPPHHGVGRLDVVHKAFGAVRGFQRHGYVFLDFGPHNVLVTRDGTVKLIDLEFVYHHPEYAKMSFIESPSVLGPRARRYDEPVPLAGEREVDWYERYWRPVTLLPLEVVLNAAPWEQQLRRVGPKFRVLLRRKRSSLKRSVGLFQKKLRS